MIWNQKQSDYYSKQTDHYLILNSINLIQSSLDMINPRSSFRQSRLIANQGTIVNQTELVTPTHGLVKRTIYHTPAIIQTVVDTPQTALNIPTNRSTVMPYDFDSHGSIRRVQSAIVPSHIPYNNHPEYLPHPRDISKVLPTPQGDLVGFGRGLKVSEDLKGYKQYTDSSERKTFAPQPSIKKDYCGNVLGYCWGNRCPWWLFVLIPILLILLLLVISRFINRHRVFYGFDTSATAAPLNVGYQNGLNNPALVAKQEHNISYPINYAPNTGLNQGEIVSPIVSTTGSSITNYAYNTPHSIYNQPVLPQTITRTTETNTTDISGNSIYNRVNMLRQQGGHNPPALVNSPVLVNQPPLVQRTQIVSNTPNYQLPIINPQAMAPTIEQVQTKAMMEADRYSSQMKNSMPLVHHIRKSHLRFDISG